jgi:hypothetical protein
MPTGTPNRVFFIVGGVGCAVNIVAAIWFFVFDGLATFVSLSFYADWIIGYVLLSIGLILASIGYLGIRRNYGSGVGAAGFGLAISVAIMFLSLISWYNTAYPFARESQMTYDVLWIAVYELFFAMMILWGVTHITTRRSTGKSGLSCATGIILVITAVFLNVAESLSSVLTINYWYWYNYNLPYNVADLLQHSWGVFTIIWTLMFLVGEILAIVLFFTAKVPELKRFDFGALRGR